MSPQSSSTSRESDLLQIRIDAARCAGWKFYRRGQRFGSISPFGSRQKANWREITKCALGSWGVPDFSQITSDACILISLIPRGTQVRLSNKAGIHDLWWCYIDDAIGNGEEIAEAICRAFISWSNQ